MREPVVHVHLDVTSRNVAHLEDRDAFHCRPPVSARGLGATRDRARCAAARARTRRPASPWSITSPRSTPRWTIVCAICGRMPLMMQSAPISRAAATVLSRCCATSVSTVGTPVMSMIAIAAPVSTMRCSRLSITTCVRSLSSVPISGSARMPSQSLTTGVDSSSISCCWRMMTSSRDPWYASVVQPSEFR